MPMLLDLLYQLVLSPLRLFLELVYAISYRVLASEGLAIICLSLAVNLLMLPVYNKADSLRTRAQEKEKAMARGVSHIRRTFAGDERFLILSEYYAQNRYSPLSALLSSLSILLQLPFFFTAYHYLSGLQDLHSKSFLFIEDLGRCDALLSLPSCTVNVLPLAMTLLNCISSAVYTRGQGMREKLQAYLLAALFLVLLYNSPAGLVLYWTMNNLFSLLKNLWSRLCRKRAGGSGVAWVRVLKVRPPLVLLRPLPEGGQKQAGIFLLSCMLLVLLNGLALPLALLSSSTAEFSSLMNYANPLRCVLGSFFQALGLFALWPLCAYLLCGGDAALQGRLAFLAAVLALCSLADAYAFPGRYGDLSSSLTFLNAVDFRTVSPFSFANLLFLLGLATLVRFFFRARRTFLVGGSLTVFVLALLSFSFYSAGKVQAEYRDYRLHVDRSRVDSVQPLFALSRNRPNVVLIMLDRAQPQFVGEIFREAPELEEAFAGFTLYENALSFNAHTLAGLPPLFGGYEYTPLEMNRRDGETLAEKNNQSQLLLARVLTEQAGFSSAVIADPQYGNYSLFCDSSFISPYGPKIRGAQTKEVYSSFWYRQKNIGGLSDPRTDGLRRNLLFFSFFRSFPVCLRRAVYQGGNYWSTASFSNMKELIDSYSVLDYLPELTGISQTEGGCYMSLVNELTHCSQFLQAPAYIPVDDASDRGTSSFRDWDAYPPQMAAFRMLAAWFSYLKAEGVYDNTRIVIASDHGCRGEEAAMEEDRALDRKISGGDYHGRGHYHPLLMFKDFGSPGGADPAFVDDRETFMTNADAPSLLLGGLVARPVNPFTQKEIPLDTRPLKEAGVVISASDAHRPSDNGGSRYNVRDGEWWLVRDPIFKASSWTQLERPE